MRLLILAICALALTSCVSDKYSWFTAADSKVPLEPLSLTAGWEVYGLRVDLVRAQQVDPSMISNGEMIETKRADRKQAYDFLGVELGNGLFLDENGNLSVDLVQLYGWKGDFSLESTQTGFFSSKASWKRSGNTFRSVGGWAGTSSREVTFEPNKVTIDEPFVSPQIITVDQNKIQLNTGGLLSLGNETITQRSPDLVTYPTRLGGATLERPSPDQLKLNGFVVTQEGNLLKIKWGWLLSEHSLTFMRTPTGCVFYNQNRHGEISLVDHVLVIKGSNFPTQVLHVSLP